MENNHSPGKDLEGKLKNGIYSPAPDYAIRLSSIGASLGAVGGVIGSSYLINGSDWLSLKGIVTAATCALIGSGSLYTIGMVVGHVVDDYKIKKG
ncbi:MAG TPA: hypothetical protein HA282_00540 [Nanoarchaeota archaeon]|nr:hypothetical protein [Candidatus Pacearchaeota archaeon]HIH17733.1 hypothetical protein [Nanoarchaeota archaeon]HIH33797.1 hypothetical protein [Nanoarchaeota archaeon]HIH51624.1 hypothetical protein [Nanoarchaeota archaeon]HIH65689.1 hypothetical protein [Nanoarchaeota archaeon]